jgi:tetratricopeptide (TPR) repeat protein
MTMMQKILIILLAVWGGAAIPDIALAAGGGGGGMSMPRTSQPRKQLSPDELAQRSYKRAVKHRQNAAKYEQKAEKQSSDKGRDKQLARAAKEYQRCRDDLDEALKHNPNMVAALSDLGFVHRKQGDCAGSLVSYDKALELDPQYTPAIEYRGEAYLQLGRIDDAKEAYMVLFRRDRELADQLMDAMQVWVQRHRGEPEGTQVSGLDEFEQWLTERADLAAQTAALATPAERRW